MQKFLFISLTSIFISILGIGIAQAYIPYPNINPIAFSIYGFQVRWYGLFYLFGFIGAFLINHFLLILDHKKSNYYNAYYTSSQFFDVAINTFLGAIIGGRIGYVLLYNLPYYIHHPLQIFAVHDGGMSFHGGLIGAGLVIFFQTRKSHNFWQVADMGATVIPFALGLGRIGNFINDELWGRVTNVPWAVLFPQGGYLPRHPSQLYESFLEGVVLLCIMIFLRTRRLNQPGLLAGSFVLGYGICRFIVEFFRNPDPQIGYIFNYFTEGQLLSIPMIVAGIYIIYIRKKHKYNYLDYMKFNKEYQEQQKNKIAKKN